MPDSQSTLHIKSANQHASALHIHAFEVCCSSSIQLISSEIIPCDRVLMIQVWPWFAPIPAQISWSRLAAISENLSRDQNIEGWNAWRKLVLGHIFPRQQLSYHFSHLPEALEHDSQQTPPPSNCRNPSSLASHPTDLQTKLLGQRDDRIILFWGGNPWRMKFTRLCTSRDIYYAQCWCPNGRETRQTERSYCNWSIVCVPRGEKQGWLVLILRNRTWGVAITIVGSDAPLSK